MAHYIDKDALVAEIERRTDELWALIPDGEKVTSDKHTKEDAFNLGRYTALESLDKFIDTLEVKEVDLQEFTEKINTFQARYKHPEITSIKGAMAFMARMFYQYPNVAREWYESLPKATMD